MQLFVTFYSSFVNWCSDRLETDKIIMKILLASACTFSYTYRYMMIVEHHAEMRPLRAAVVE